MCQCIFKSIYSRLVVGYTWYAGLELRVVMTGVPQRHHRWLNVLRLDSIVSCLATGLIIFSVLFVLRIERCHMRMASLQMRQLEKYWNHNMAQQFFPSWINDLDASMMEWFNKWAPGFMFVVRKPHPFGN